VATELQSFHNNPDQNLTLGEGEKVCKQAVDWNDVARSPVLYRGRCALVYGDVSLTDLSARVVKVGPEPLTGMPAVLVDIGGYDPATLWAGHTKSPSLFALGTIQGIREGMPYVTAEAIWMPS